MKCKFYFQLFTDDWIMTGGKHWLFKLFWVILHLLSLMRCKFHFQLFIDDWIMTAGKHWLFSFIKELSLFVESIKIPLTITPYSNQG